MPQTPVRIPPVPRDEWTDEHRDVFAYFGEPDARENGSRTNTVNTFANHPSLALAYFGFSKGLMLGGTLPKREIELIVLRVAWLTKSEYEWHFHVGYALNHDMTLDEIAALKEPADAFPWGAADRAIIMAVDEIESTHRISDATWATLAAHFDKKQLMEIVFTIGSYFMTSWAIHALGIQIEDWNDTIGFDLKTASGKTPVRAYKPGEVDDWMEKNEEIG